MHFVYLGFTQRVNTRCYRFQALTPTERATESAHRTELVVAAEMSLLARYRIPLQDGPALCLELLAAKDVVANRPESYALTPEDLSVFTTRRTAIAEAKAARRKPRTPLKPPPTAQWKWPQVR